MIELDLPDEVIQNADEGEQITLDVLIKQLEQIISKMNGIEKRIERLEYKMSGEGEAVI